MKLNAVFNAGCLLIIIPSWTKPGIKLKEKLGSSFMVMLVKNLFNTESKGGVFKLMLCLMLALL